MNIDDLSNAKFIKKRPENIAAGAIYIAIRDAEIHETKLAVKNNGKIEEFTPDEMRARLSEG